MGRRTPFITPALVTVLVCGVACVTLQLAGVRADSLPKPFVSYIEYSERIGFVGDWPRIEALAAGPLSPDWERRTPHIDTLPESRGGQDVVDVKMPPLRFDRWLNTDGGKPLDTAGVVTLYRWWTDGCAHCEKTLPAVEKLRLKYGPHGLRVVAVYHPKPPRRVKDTDVLAAAKGFGYDGPLAIDQDWSELKRFYLSGGNRAATSASFLVDGEGSIRFVHPGPRFYASADKADAQENADYRLIERAVKRLLDVKESEPLRQARAVTE